MKAFGLNQELFVNDLKELFLRFVLEVKLMEIVLKRVKSLHCIDVSIIAEEFL